MSSNIALKHLTELLLNGKYDKMANTAIADLKKTNMPIAFLSANSMLVKFAFDRQLNDLARRLHRQSISGMNAVASTTNTLDADIKALKLKSITGKAKTENLIEYLKSKDCKVAYANKIVEAYDNIKDTENFNSYSPISTILYSVAKAKLTANSSEIGIEMEKSFEPLVMSIINNNKVNGEITTEKIREEVRSLLTQKSGLKESQIDGLYHDLSLASLMHSINPMEYLQVGIDNGTANPMVTVDNKGQIVSYFEFYHKDPLMNARFLSDLTPSKEQTDYSELLKNGKSGTFTALKCLQERAGFGELDRATGTVTSRVANPEKVARVLFEMVILCDKINAEVDDDFVTAIMNPLIDVIETINDHDKLNEIVVAAVKDAKLAAQNTGNIHSATNAKNKGNTTQTAVPATQVKPANPILKADPKTAPKKVNTGMAKSPDRFLRNDVIKNSCTLINEISYNGRFGEKNLVYAAKEIIRQLGIDIEHFLNLDEIRNVVEKGQPKKFNAVSKKVNMSTYVREYFNTIIALSTDKKLKTEISNQAVGTAHELVETIMQRIIQETTPKPVKQDDEDEN